MKRSKKILSFLLASVIAVCSFASTFLAASAATVQNENIGQAADEAEAGTYSLIVEGFDWGPAVTKVVLYFEDAVPNVNYEDFTVFAVRDGALWGSNNDYRTVINSYPSTADGTIINHAGPSNYITLEMEVHPGNDLGSPFFYNFFAGGLNVWVDYKCTITDTETGMVWDTKTGQRNVIAEEFEKGSVSYSDPTYGDITLQYAAYDPGLDYAGGATSPLVVWLHGAGEGGTDPDVALIGNKVVNLATDDIQDIFGGAFILAPQSPTMWMNDGTGGYTDDGTSMYTEALMNLITTYVDENPYVDKNRIYIGGCSNGGYMTMNMLFSYSDYFASAYPVCEAYKDEWITDDMIESIKDIPMWFTHAANDTTVSPASTVVPTYNRLKDAGAEVYLTMWDNVVDTSGLYKDSNGNPYEYMGHWSWLYTLNNECTLDYDGTPVRVGDQDVTIMEWLAAQSKDAVPSRVTDAQAIAEVTLNGTVLRSLQVTVDDASLLDGLTAEDFTVDGISRVVFWIWEWETPFTATASSIEVNGNTVTINFDGLNYSFDSLTKLDVTCSANAGLNFGLNAISGVITPVADDFETFSVSDGNSFNYALYTPENTSEPLPLVLALHGGGEYGDGTFINLTANRLVTAWAEPQNQAERPAYVLAPQFGAEVDTHGETIKVIQQMIDDGKVDPNRVYVTGGSMGGQNTFIFITQYPDMFAAAVPICPAIGGMIDTLAFENIVNMPIWLTHNISDPTIDITTTSYVAKGILEDLGSTSVDLRVYSDEEVAAAGITNMHDAWEMTVNDMEIVNWLFSQSKSDADALSGSFNWLVKAYDHGPGIDKFIIEFDEEIDERNIDNETFTVATAGSERLIKEVYLANPDGSKALFPEDDSPNLSKYVTIECGYQYSGFEWGSMYIGSYDGGAFVRDGVWRSAGDHAITLNKNIGEYNALSLTDNGKLTPEGDKFDSTGRFTASDGIALSYATYSPQEDGKKNPLIIWLHGAGEGGTDPTVTIYGNRVVNLASDEIQEYYDGAYILAPQSPTMWMNDGSGNYTNDGTSMYTESLMELITSYVDSNPDVDTDRIYIGGCSNGGYMTMNMLFHYGEYFTAAYPICEAYNDSWITDDMIESIKDIPIWFIQAQDDTVVAPVNHVDATYERLVAAGAENIHYSSYPNVIDSKGNRLMGHFSWVYFLNGTAECTLEDCCDGLNAHEWLAQQRKPVDLYTRILERTVAYAEQADRNGELDDVIKTVRDAFYSRLADAQAVLANALSNNPTVSQDDVDEAADRLMQIIFYLDFKVADKTELTKLVALAEKYEADKDLYSAGSYAPFQLALDAARELIADEDLMDAGEVQDAYADLYEAIIGLRYIPNKDLLSKLIIRAEATNLSLYTADTAAAVMETLEIAKTIMADDKVEQKTIDAAADDLDEALANLKPVKAPVGDDKTESEGTDDESKDTNTASTNTKKSTTAPSNPKTGDSAQTGAMLLIIAVCGLAVFALRKRGK